MSKVCKTSRQRVVAHLSPCMSFVVIKINLFVLDMDKYDVCFTQEQITLTWTVKTGHSILRLSTSWFKHILFV